MKQISVADQTDEIDVTLWRRHSALDIRAGDFVKISNATVGYFEKKKNLSTTQLSTIEVCTEFFGIRSPKKCIYFATSTKIKS